MTRSRTSTKTKARRTKVTNTPDPREQQRQPSNLRKERVVGGQHAPAAPAPLYDTIVRELGYDPMPGTT